MADTHEGSFRNLVGRPSSLLMGMKKKIYPEIGNDAIWTVRFDFSLKWTVNKIKVDVVESHRWSILSSIFTLKF